MRRGTASSEGFMLSLIYEAFSGRPAQVDGWRIEVGNGALRRYVYVGNDRLELPEQGWKLHVSATPLSAEEVLSRTLPVLLAEDASFKVVASITELRCINSGMCGRGQVGKFITVYPKDDEQALRLAVALDEATRGLDGPLVPSDRPLLLGSLVHYRYGGFRTRLIQKPSGELQHAIVARNGELVRDVRSASYHAPEWTVDPFISAGIAAPPAEPEKVIAGRYLIINTPYRSPWGALHQALDIESVRRCVLKQRQRSGRDYLRNEADVLASLAPDPRFPEVFGLVEDKDGDLFLAMEHVEGETLEQHVSGLATWGRHVPGEQVVGWGRELAAMLRKIHEEGFVYRDLKMENVIIAPDGHLRMLDFELACQPENENQLSGIGTRGYCSPQRVAGDPPSVADDVYGLGALLYTALTSSFAPVAPRPLDLLASPVELLNSAAGPALVNVITRCLDPEPAARFPSMAALDRTLARIREEASVVPARFGAEVAVEPETRARQRCLEMAKRLGDTLVKEARRPPEGQGSMWVTESLDTGGLPLRDLCVGGAGAVLALAELVEELADPMQYAALSDGALWLKETSCLGAQPLPGFYVGEAGITGALLRAGQVLGDGELINAAAERGRWVSSLPYASPDMFNGAAGRLRLHLLLWDETNDPEHLRYAVEAGEFLLETAEDTTSGHGSCWRIPPGYGGLSGNAYLGYAHGAAGIADALLDLFEVTSEERFLSAVWGAGQWLVSLAIPVLDDESGLNWPPTEGSGPAGVTWCHGAPGIGRFFLHAAELDVLPEAASVARRAARTAARGSRALGPTQCHGLSGNIEFLLDMAQRTGEKAYLTEARSLSRLLEAFSQEKDEALVWPSDMPNIFSPDYMTGYAGVAVCLLRMSDPERRPHQLSRCGFRYRAPLG